MSDIQGSEERVRSSRLPVEEVDLRAYWRVIQQRRWLVLAIFAASVLATLLVTLRQPKLYASTATLIIDLNAPRILNKEQVQDVVDSGGSGYVNSREFYETQYRVITSRAVAQRVVDKLQLARDAHFLGLDHIKDKSLLEAALAKADPIPALQARLSVLPVKDSRVVRVQVEDRDPTLAAALANAVAEAYIAENLSVRSTTTQSASEWLEQQLADLETKLAKSADELFKFKQANDIVGTTWEDRQGMINQRIQVVNDALTRARVDKAAIEARKEQMEAAPEAVLAAGDAPTSDPMSQLGSQSLVVQQLKLALATAQMDCADLASNYLKDHPRLLACQAKIASTRKALDSELQEIVEGVRREHRESVQKEKKLVRLLTETKADAFGLNDKEKEYLELKRTYDNNQRLYELVLQRLKETGVTAMMQMSNVRILDRAEPSWAPVSPRPVRNLAIAILVGLVGGIGLAFLLEMLDTTISSREQVEERLGVPLLGIIPAIERDKQEAGRDLFVHANPRSAAAECLRSIRTNLLFMSPDRPLKTILVTSSAPSEGKTLTATSLAETMADGGGRVLLVDADMRRPRVHKVFGIHPEQGLSSLILGEGSLSAAVYQTGIENLAVLACGPIPPNPAELLHTEGFRAILVEAAKRFDRVIIDSPPAGVVADAMVISTLVDGTLFVLKTAETSRDAAARALRGLHDVNARVFGAVLNDVDLDDRKYAQYSYYYSYGYYSGERGSDAPAERQSA